MQLKLIAFSLIIIQSFYVFSQQKSAPEPKDNFWENVQFGGGLQLGVSRFQNTLGLSPSAVYSFSEQFGLGIGTSYLYSKLRSQDISYHLFGGSTFALYNPIKEIQLSTEFEMLNINSFSLDEKDSYWDPAWYVGLGYGLGKHSAIGIRYNILFDKENSIYDSAYTPFIRIFF
jgi:long-subunit fatty acid transport protein